MWLLIVERGVWCQALVLCLGVARPRCLAALPAPGAGSWGLLPMCHGRGRAGVGAQNCPLGVHALRGTVCRGGGEGLSRGG